MYHEHKLPEDIYNAYKAHRCDIGHVLIDDAISVWQNETAVSQIRDFLGHCDDCYHDLNTQINMRHVLRDKTREQTPPNLRLEISKTLGSVNLNDLTWDMP